MKKNLFIIFILLLQLNSYSQNKRYSVGDSIEGYSFSFEQPQNWVLDTLNASDYLAQAAIFKSKADYKNGGLIIQILAYKKQDEDTQEDLNYDVNAYKEEYKNLKEKEFIINHAYYPTYAREVYVEGSFYQYIVYINPGRQYEFGLSVALNINNREIDQKDLEIFKEIVKSIQFSK